ncbi:MAG: SPOR domain-containing protein [Candidatus Hydrogenedentales bacterium]|jgi:hypothetical protein
MANSNRTKGYDGDDRPTYQFTSYQLVMAICAVLLLMVLVFMAGSFVQGLDGSRPKSSEEAIGSSSGQDTALAEKKPDKPKPVNSIGTQARKEEGKQVSPKPVTISQQGSPSGTAGSKPSTPMKTSQNSGAAYIPAPPPSRPSSQAPATGVGAQDKTGAKDTKPGAKTEEPGGELSPAKKPDATSAVQPGNSTEVASPASSGTQPGQPTPEVSFTPAPAVADTPMPKETTPKPAEPEKTQVAKADATLSPAADATADSVKGGFTVQVASFESTKRDVVDSYVKRIKSNSDFDVRILPTKDNRRLRICIGQFADKTAAEKARDDLRSVKEFKDCWVLALND